MNKECILGILKEGTIEVIDDVYAISFKDVKIILKQSKDKIAIKQNKNGTALDQHLYRILKHNFPNKVDTSELTVICQAIRDITNDIYGYCTICGNKLNFKSTRIDNCKKEECVIEYEITVTSDIVISAYRQSNDILLFIIKTSINALKDPKRDQIFTPFPYNLVSSIKKRDKLNVNKTETDKDFTTLTTIIPKEWYDGNISLTDLEYINSDIGVHAVYGEKLYGYLKFLLTTNRTELYQRTIDLYVKDKTHKYEIYEINYDRDTEAKYKNGKYLFHGSGKQNWYSILRNGLKNCSKSLLMRHGAACGDGIYFAGVIQTSFGYGPIVGVCRVNNSEKYTKDPFGTGIYVVTNEDDVLLKYIIIGRSNNAELVDSINKYFLNLDKQQQPDIKSPTSLSNRRLVKELSMIKDDNIKVSYTDIYMLTVELFGFKNKLNASLKKIGMESIILSIKINSDYPTVPPLVAIKRPKINSRYVNNGAIMFDCLSKFRWKISDRLYNILRMIHHTLMEEDAEVSSGEYDVEKAYNIFQTNEKEYK